MATKPVASQTQILETLVGSIHDLTKVMLVQPAELLGALNALRVEQEMMYQQQIVRSLQEQQQRAREEQIKLEEESRKKAIEVAEREKVNTAPVPTPFEPSSPASENKVD